ncbi:DNA-binding LacI/PurR family transcriptional regulator [Nakamurella sp. UYEF19]|uniref:LacI family DNA-binding transcriptional regulator n=1 Tax=Nakamurella sp. UYEF19 TaxID=1756392 RepID=UPI0033933376
MSPHPDLLSTRGGPTIGLVLRRPAGTLGLEPFFESLIAGMEEVAEHHRGSVLLQIAPDLEAERETYRRWGNGGHVAGVLIIELVEGDDRAAFLRSLQLPAVVLGEPAAGESAVALRVDNYGATIDAVNYLGTLGHRHIGRVSGPPELLHTRSRSKAFTDALELSGYTGVVVAADYTAEGGARATAELLDLETRPTAIFYDNDVMAAAGLDCATARGVRVPADLSILAWDDSTTCRMTAPPLSAMNRDLYQLGEIVATLLLELIAGRPAASRAAPPSRIIARGSTTVAPGFVPTETTAKPPAVPPTKRTARSTVAGPAKATRRAGAAVRRSE